MAGIPSLHPVLKALEDGRVIRAWVAGGLRIIAVLGALAGLVGAFQILKTAANAGETFGGLVLAAFAVVMVVAVAQILFYRAQAVNNLGDSPFTVIPIVSQLLRGTGEVYAAVATVLGLGGALFIWLTKENPLGLVGGFARLLPDSARAAGGSFAGGLLFLGWLLVVGFVVLILFYFLAETSVVLADIARNTRRLAERPATGGSSV